MNVSIFELLRRIGWVLFALLAQTTLAPRLALFGIQPSILLAIFFLFSLKVGSLASIWTGFGVGLVLDVYIPGVPGGFSLGMAIVGFLVGLFNEQRVHTDYLTRVVLLGIACLVHDTIWFLMARHGWTHLMEFLIATSAPSAIYTMLIGAGFIALRPPPRTERRW
jgi:rod shape-determining protein MreD